MPGTQLAGTLKSRTPLSPSYSVGQRDGAERRTGIIHRTTLCWLHIPRLGISPPGGGCRGHDLPLFCFPLCPWPLMFACEGD